MPAAVAIPAITSAVGIGTSLFGGANSASAAKSAAAGQSQAAQQAGQKVQQAVVDANPQIIQGAANASDMALRAGGQVVDSAGQARDAVTGAVTRANSLLDPYATAGSGASDTLAAGLRTGGDFNKMPTLKDLQLDPSFDFLLQQQLKSKTRAAAARGGIDGTTLMDLSTFETGLRSQQYQKAFENFETATQSRFNNLNTVAGRGQQASGQQGTNLINGTEFGGNIVTDAYKTNLQANEFAGSQTYDAAKTTANNTIGGADRAAEYLTEGANAQAAGNVGAANAWNSALGGAANAAAAGGAMYLNNKNFANYLKNPAANGVH
jgi:hypothetical protein